jgi:hypothetical protein
MWHTSHGDRTLRGLEAAVFAESMRSLLDFAATMGWDQYPVEIPAFDNLTSGQKVHALLTVAQGLLCEEVPKVQLTAALEATVAAVFYQLETMVTLELDDPEAGHYWKDRVKAALNDAEANTANFVPGTGIPAAGESGDDPFNLPPGDEALKQAIRDGLEIAQHDMLEDIFGDYEGPPISGMPETEPAITLSQRDQWDLHLTGLMDHILWDRDYETADTYVDLPPVLSDVLKEEMRIERDYFVTVPNDLSPAQAEQTLKEIKELCSTFEEA